MVGGSEAARGGFFLWPCGSLPSCRLQNAIYKKSRQVFGVIKRRQKFFVSSNLEGTSKNPSGEAFRFFNDEFTDCK
jgi:hypothetical protein